MKNFIEENNLLSKEDACLAAVSGGADSMCMLSLLAEYCGKTGNRLGVVSVNHGFRPEAAEEAAYVERYCRDRDIPFFLKEIRPGECEASEEAARNYRYKLIKEAALEGGFTKIALAHNACDRAETMLFNLFRGTGITGLAGIRASRDEFIRPILFMQREEIEAYLEEKNILFYTDASNLKDEYSRNKIRHHIIPLSQDINSESISHMNSTADSLAAISAYIERQTRKAFESTVYEADGGKCVDIDKFTELDEVIQSSLIRLMLTDMTPKLKDITSEHIAGIIGLAHREGNGSVNLPYGIRAFREYGRIRIANLSNEDSKEPTEIEVELNLSGESETKEYQIGDSTIAIRIFDAGIYGGYEKLMESMPRNKYTKWFDCDKISKPIILRARQEGDYLVVDKEGHCKSVNRCMIDFKIPEALRDRVVLAASGNEIIWIVGYRESYAYRIDSDTHNILEIKLLEV